MTTHMSSGAPVTRAELDVAVARLESHTDVAVAGVESKIDVAIARLESHTDVAVAGVVSKIDVAIARLETLIERSAVTQIRWLVGTTFGLYALMFGLILFVVSRELAHP